MEISPPQRASPPFTPFHPFVKRVGVKGCACIKSSMLGNEKYKGDARLQKTYTVDFLTKEVRINRGERKQIYIKDSHDAIISPETFELVQQEIKRRTARKGRFYDSPFTGKIVCGCCGAYYGHRVWDSNNRYRRNIWLCNDKYKGDAICAVSHLTDADIVNAYIIAVNRLIDDWGKYCEEFEIEYMPIIADIAPLQKEHESIKADMAELAHQIESLIHNNATRPQDQEQYSQGFSLLEDKLKQKKAAAEKLDQQISDALVRRKSIEIFLEGLKTVGECITEFEISTWHRLVENMKVMPDKTLLFQMRNGSTISVSLEEAKRRH